MAVGITAGTEQLNTLEISGLFLLAYLGGIAAGLVTVWLSFRVRKRVQDPLLGNVVTILTPFTAFVLAELINASGVLAVVVVGLAMSQAGPRIIRAETRQQGQAFWSLTTFLLNGALFVLVGLELPRAVSDLPGRQLAQGLFLVAVVTAVIVAVRLLYLFLDAYVFRLLDRRERRLKPRVNNRIRVVSGMAGFRGAVSLAAALATPQHTASGAPFPYRDLIIFVATGVIILTLVVQAPLLPVIARWARMPLDAARRKEEQQLAETSAVTNALEALPQVAAELGTDPDVADEVRTEYERRLATLLALQDEEQGNDDGARHLARAAQYRDLGLALLALKRGTVIRLRDERRIDDAVLLQVQSSLDVEELRLSSRGDPGGDDSGETSPPVPET